MVDKHLQSRPVTEKAPANAILFLALLLSFPNPHQTTGKMMEEASRTIFPMITHTQPGEPDEVQ